MPEMKKSLSILLLLLCFSQHKAFSHDSTRFKKNIVFIEVLGNGLYGSINYERNILSSEYLKWNLRCGISNWVFNNNKRNTFIPLSTSLLFGRTKNFFELSFGYTAILGTSYLYYEPGTKNSKPSWLTQKYDEICYLPQLGYRYQNKSLMVNIHVSIAFESSFNIYSGNIYPWTGLGLGYCF